MHIDFATLKNVLPYVIKARKPILIRGKHGLGKSEVAKSLANDVANILEPDAKNRAKRFGNKDYIYPIVERRASQMPDAGDLMGLPQLDGCVTKFLPMAWFAEACQKPVILFFDEVDRACTDVRQALFELTDSRKLAGHVLHPDTIIIACVNGGLGETAYQVGDMDPAELNRWTVFDVKPTVEDWLQWAKNKVDPLLWDFIKSQPAHLEHNGEFEPNKVYPSRRSWIRFNEACKNTNLISDFPIEMSYLCAGFLGQEAAIAFFDFCKNYKRMVTVEDVIVKGDFKHAKTLENNQHIALIDKFADHDLFKAAMDPNYMENLAQYLKIVPAELAMKLWQVVTCAHSDNGIVLHQTKVDGSSIGSYLAKINGAE